MEAVERLQPAFFTLEEVINFLYTRMPVDESRQAATAEVRPMCLSCLELNPLHDLASSHQA